VVMLWRKVTSVVKENVPMETLARSASTSFQRIRMPPGAGRGFEGVVV
jgi:hypothetical protein